MNTGLRGLLLVSALAAVMAGCTKEDDLSSVSKEMTVFEVTSEFPTQKGATMNITHNGPADCRYAGCAFEYGTSIDEAIAGKIEELRSDLAEDAMLAFDDVTFSGNSSTDVVTGLLPNRKYSYVVFGLDEDFSVYGTRDTCVFTTQTGAAPFNMHVVVAETRTVQVEVQTNSRFDDTYPYYVFWTTDLETPVDRLIEKEVGSLDAPAEVIDHGRKIFNVPDDFPGTPDLEPGKKYRIVVTGLYDDGTVYGLPVDMTFKTDRGDLPYYEHEDWVVEYTGKGLYSGRAVDNITVTSADEERFFISVVEEDRLAQAGEITQALLREVIAQETEAQQKVIDEYAAFGIEATWYDYSYTGTVERPVEALEEGEKYYALAIGIDVDGVVTGEYQVSDAFEPEVLSATEDYLRWVGTWTVSANYVDQDDYLHKVSFDIEIKGSVPGIGYTVSGFGKVDGLMEEDINVPDIGVLYDDETGAIQWIGSYLGPVDMGDEIGYSASIYFAALADYDVIAGENFVMAESRFTDDGNNSASVVATPFKLDDGSMFTAKSMGYVAQMPYIDGYMLASVNPSLDEDIRMVRKTGENQGE